MKGRKRHGGRRANRGPWKDTTDPLDPQLPRSIARPCGVYWTSGRRQILRRASVAMARALSAEPVIGTPIVVKGKGYRPTGRPKVTDEDFAKAMTESFMDELTRSSRLLDHVRIIPPPFEPPPEPKMRFEFRAIDLASPALDKIAHLLKPEKIDP